MKIGTIEFALESARASAALTGIILLAVTISMWTGGCDLYNFTSAPVGEKVVPHPAGATSDAYEIGRDDELEIIVWNQTQLCGKQIVGSDGTIDMPLIGRIPAAGLTPEKLKADLEKRYAGYVHDPNVTVRVSDPESYVFYVLGEVNKPGVYKLHSGEVLSQALAEAGGLKQFADPGRIRILRHKENETVVLTINYNTVPSGSDVSADVPIARGDTVTVP